ncbi:MAG: GDSL-type esterase/lipase family protein [Acidobacteriota bacterium]|nr:GDSL-type esterase/lipase family protein [Acidobacteriota bacterium]
MNSSSTIRVFFFGDSICFGQGVAIHRGWVTKISASLTEVGRQYGREITVTNASINGNTTRQALERMPYDIQSQAADILVTQFGMNDCNYWQTDGGNPRVSPKAFGANLEEIIARAFSFGAREVLLNTNHPTARDQELMPNAGVTYQQSNERYNQIIREVAAGFDERVTLIDVESIFKTCTENKREALLRLLLPDLLHLSETGHDIYFEAVYPKVLSAVMRLIGN